MSFLPASISSAIGSHDARAPGGISTMGVPGIMGLSVSGNSAGPSASSTQSVLSGVASMSASNAQNTSSVNVVGNPRHQTQNTYPIDMTRTTVHDIGDFEIHFVDLENKHPGPEGQDCPYPYKSVSALNAYLYEEPQRLRYGNEKSEDWFDSRFRIAGVINNEDTHDRPHLDSGLISQAFTFAGHAKVYDIFQAYMPELSKKGQRKYANNCQSLGANVNDMVWLVLRRFPHNPTEYRHLLGDDDVPTTAAKQHYWQLCPMYTPNNQPPGPVSTHDFQRMDVVGKPIHVGIVMHIYNAPGDGNAARQAVYTRRHDGSHKDHLLKLRLLDIRFRLN